MASDIPTSTPTSASSVAKRGKVDQVQDAEQGPQQRLRLKRKTPKVKTGCLTCRTRRVKCDEGKPACKRCEKFGICCGGYPVPIEKPQARTRQIAPKVYPLMPKARPKITSSLQSHHIHAGPRFTDEQESRYFAYYCDGISSQLGGPFKSKLWDQLIPQAGEMEPFIGRALIALGALYKSMALRSSNSQNQTLEPENPHHQYALSQYCKALEGMRKSIQDNPLDARTALIGCLLIFCFESLQGHQGAASAHASSGINAITNMCRRGWQPKSWKDSELGEDLYAAFSSLDLQSLLFLDRRPQAMHQKHKQGLNAAVAAMPNEFPDLQECRRYWHYIMRRNLHFSLEVRDAMKKQSPPDDRLRTYREFPDLGAGDSPWIDHTQATTPRPIFLLAERDLYVQDICRWEIASAPLLCKLFSRSSNDFENSEDFLVANLLRIHAAMNIVLLTRAFNPPETEYEKFESQFRTITELSERIHHLLVAPQSKGEGSTFRFDVGILPALSQVGLLCRARGIRGRAINLLKRSKGYKEGIWDAEAVGAIDDWIKGLEEEWWVEGIGVPGERRVTLFGCDMRLNERWASVVVRQGNGIGGWVDREEVVRW